jgi:linoleoyl-CoA desaturase
VAVTETGSPKVSFENGGAFLRDVRSDVEELVAAEASHRGAARRLYAKAPLAIGLLAVSWLVLMFERPAGLLAVACLAGLAVGGTLVAFCIQHDANHGAYFEQRRHNHLVGWTSDVLLGFSSYAWRVKHNVAHHTYTNVVGYDADIDQAPYLRLTPSEPSGRRYRLQHLYIWPLYSLMGLRWQLVGDISSIRRGAVGQSRLRFPKGWTLVGMIAGKALFVLWALVVPMLVYPWWVVVAIYVGINMATSVVMATTFQLAHCVEEADFVSPEELAADTRVWAVHEVETTVDFCPQNKVLTWCLGGLNYQIEHHLFPRLPHTLYPAIAPIVQRNCRLHGIRYSVHPSLGAALRSHFRHVRALGRAGIRAELEMG